MARTGFQLDCVPATNGLAVELVKVFANSNPTRDCKATQVQLNPAIDVAKHCEIEFRT